MLRTSQQLRGGLLALAVIAAAAGPAAAQAQPTRGSGPGPAAGSQRTRPPADLLRLAPAAARRPARGMPLARAATTYTFSTRYPAVTCSYGPDVNGLTTRNMYVLAPVVYAADHPSQWVYWRTVVSDGTHWWSDGWNTAVAYSSSPAAFNPPTEYYSPLTNLQVYVNLEVWWWSTVYGWHSAVQRVPVYVTISGLGTFRNFTC